MAEEWLVTDQRGAFAMGTPSGVRTRKYHGFYLGIAGRAETAFLVDLDLKLNGKSIWPHRFDSPQGPVVHPDPLQAATHFAFDPTRVGPRWRWEFPEGKLFFGVEPNPSGGAGTRLSWKWQASARSSPGVLEIRPFWAMRPLHGMGGETWEIESVEPPGGGENGGPRIVAIAGHSGQDAFCLLDGPFQWRADPLWYNQFYYADESERGYLAREDLYSAGTFMLDLKKAPSSAWTIAETIEGLIVDRLERVANKPASTARVLKARPAALDFVLKEPSGIVAGFPWFGEWGRDTFISLPGIAMARIAAGEDPLEVSHWAQDILMRWGEWIRMTGMIPNLIEKGGSHQWDSADGTLWWCHALASLWTFSLGGTGLFPGLEEKFSELLTLAITSLGNGRHLFIKADDNGLLEVTEPHSTWMDARVDGAAVTPRVGKLPEINALWFQARCLQWIWSQMGDQARNDADTIGRLGRLVLGCRETDRPNSIFLHSIPLAPSFVLKDAKALSQQLEEITATLWTPVGLRTLSPKNPRYRPRCTGDQTTRDQAYHQGAPWAWLGGHFEMARDRLIGNKELKAATLSSAEPRDFPIPGHIPEIFDAEPPFAPRGTPAQAWSIACYEEAVSRRKGKVDAKLTQLLTERWAGRLGQAQAILKQKPETENRLENTP